MRHTIYENCKFCLESAGTGIIFDYPESLENDNILDGFWVTDVFTYEGSLPVERGVYQCDIEVKYWEPTFPDWDADIEINAINVKKIL